MTELDQAPADSVHDTGPADQQPATEQHAGSYDRQGYPSGTTAADTDPGRYDGDAQAAIAADTTPTRQEAARRDAAGHGQDHPDDGTSPDSDSDIHAILHEDDHQPDPRTRQQAARDDAASSSTGQTADTSTSASDGTPAGGHDADIEAILHEDDHKPDPRTRQQAARDDIADGGVTTEHDPARDDQQAQSGPDPLTETAGPETSPAPDAQTPTDHDQGGQEPLYTVVQATPEMRTLGDTTPTGIGLKPAGDQLGEMEDPKASRADRARREFLSGERLHDAFDATDEWANTGKDLFSRPPTGQHTEVPVQGPAFTPVPDQELDPGNLATAALAVGILGAEFFRWGKNRVEHTRGRHRASDR